MKNDVAFGSDLERVWGHESALPKKKFWIEALLVRVPVVRRLREQILLRLLFLFLLWLSGFVAFTLDGLGAEYASSMGYLWLFLAQVSSYCWART